MFVDTSAKKILKSKVESSLGRMDISRMCRTCLEKKRNMKNLHDIHISGYRYQEMIYVCTGFEVDKDDGLPQRVCSDCAELLPNFFTFRKRSEEVHKVLSDALASKKRELTKPTTEEGTLEENPLADVKNEYSCESNEDSSHVDDNSVINHNVCIEGDNKDFESVFIEYSIDERHSLLKSTEVESTEISPIKKQDLLMAKEHNYSLDNSKLVLLFPTIYGCNICYKYFLSQVAVREHNKNHPSPPAYPTKCPHCLKLFSHQRYVVSHTRRAHPEVERFLCGYCPRKCKTETILRTHMSGHITSITSVSDDNDKNLSNNESDTALRIIKNSDSEPMVDDSGIKMRNDILYICTDEFSNPCELEKHLNEKHEIEYSSLENKFSIASGEEIADITSDGKAECRGAGQKVRTRRRSKIRNPRYKSHVCNICNKSFRDFCLLKKHKESHNSSKPYICKSGTCRKYCFATKFELDLHTHVKHYEDAVRTEGKPSEGMFVCKFCPKVFPKRRNMREHMSSHRPDKKYQCRYCEKGFNYHHHLINHERVHTKECPYLCQECGSSFNTTDKLAVHLRRHANIKPYSCTKCDKKFLTSTQLNSHMVNHDGGSFMCSSCGKTFMALATLKKHSLYHHGSEGRPAGGISRRGKAATEGKPVGGGTCHICGVSQPNMKEMDAHMKTHICQYFCPKCSKGFPIISALEAHIKTHSAGERSHVCNKCGAAFNRPEHLRGHEGRVHGGYRPVACPHCPRRFMIQADLNKHVRTHTGERPYVCNECGRSFIQSTNLRMHIRQHSGERPYKCEVCQKGFCALTTLTYHMRSHYSMASTKSEFDPIIPKSNPTKVNMLQITGLRESLTGTVRRKSIKDNKAVEEDAKTIKAVANMDGCNETIGAAIMAVETIINDNQLSVQ